MANIVFNFTDVTSTALASRKVILYPSSYPSVSSNNIAVGDAVTGSTDSNGAITFSNVVPNIYEVSISGPNVTSCFYINVPTGSATINASDISISQSLNHTVISASAHVTFSLIDITSHPFAVKKVNVTPVNNAVTITSGSIATGDMVSQNTDSSGSVVFGLVPTVYKVECVTPQKVTQFNITVPANGGSLNAKDLITVPITNTLTFDPQNINSASLAYSMVAADARFAPLGTTMGNNLAVTASWALNAISASKTISSSYSLNSKSASYAAGIENKLDKTWGTSQWIQNVDGIELYSVADDATVFYTVDETTFIENLNLPNVTPAQALIVDIGGNVSSSPTTAQELSYLSGSTSQIQTQINNKLNKDNPAIDSQITFIGDDDGVSVYNDDAGGLTIATTGGSYNFKDTIKAEGGFTDLGANTSSVAYFDTNKKLVSSTVTPTELGYLSGVTGSVQNQLNGKQNKITSGSSFNITASNAVSASWAPSTGGGTTLTTGSTYPITASVAVKSVSSVSASWASSSISASYVPNKLDLAWADTVLTETANGLAMFNYAAGSPVFETIDDAFVIYLPTLPNCDTHKVLMTNEANIVVSSTVTDTELSYLSGATGSIQDQLNNKQNKIASGSTFNITASNAISASWAPSTGGTSLTTGSTYPITSSRAITASFATTAGSVVSASYALTASHLDTVDAFVTNQWGTMAITQSFNGITLHCYNTDHDVITTDNDTTYIASLNLPNNDVSTVPIIDADGYITSSTVSDESLSYIDGLTSNAQSQLDGLYASVDILSSSKQDNITTGSTLPVTSSWSNVSQTVLAPTGSATAPAIAFASSNYSGQGSGLGIYNDFKDDLRFVSNGNTYIQFGNGACNLRSNGVIQLDVGARQLSGGTWAVLFGGLQMPVTTSISNYSASLSDNTIFVSGSNCIVSLPNVSTQNGRCMNVKLIAAGTSASIVPAGSATIDGQSSYTLSSQYKYVNLQSSASNWYVVANN
jgi:hypothetical protein